jgi:lysophospholipid acyltransferase (LPLAT)-like uncharacterized protein
LSLFIFSHSDLLISLSLFLVVYFIFIVAIKLVIFMRLGSLLKKKNGKKTILFGMARFFVDRWAASWRFSCSGPKISEPAIIAFWHDQIYPVSKFTANSHCVALISPSTDGQLLAAFLKEWGHEFIHGSSARHSSKVLKLLIDVAKTRKVFVTPDGPKGPRHKMKVGAVLAAQKARVPLYLLKANCKGWRFKKSWDRFLVPWLFTKIKVTVSDPLYVPESCKKEELHKFLNDCETWLNT